MRFQHSTVEQLRARVREEYRNARGIRAGKLSRWLLTLSDTQLRGLFGLTAAQVTTFRSRLQQRDQRLTDIEGVAGE